MTKFTDHTDPDNIPAARSNTKRVTLICLALAVPFSLYLIFFAFSDNDMVNKHGFYAHALGVVLAFASSFLFMGIMFYSARSGHDAQPNYREMVERQRAREAGKDPDAP